MTISEVIAALQAIQAVHGDLDVLHHDDWNEFIVESVDVDITETHTVVVIEGEERWRDLDVKDAYTDGKTSKVAE